MRGIVSLLLVVAVVSGSTSSLNAGVRAEQHAITAARDILLEGSRIRVRGDLHANGNAVLVGQITVEGLVEGARAALSGEVRAAGVVQGAAAAAVPGMEFAALRARATRVLTGDQQFRGVAVLPGITYVAGSVTIEGVVFGAGLLVAEGEVRLANTQFVSLGTPLGILAGQRLVIDASRLNFRGLLHSPGSVLITGREISLTGGVIGTDVQIRGADITITADPAVFSITLPPIFPPFGALSPPTIERPRNNAIISDSAPVITVAGTAPPGATVRLALRNRDTGQESNAETSADAAGRFQTVMPLPAGLFGMFTLTAVAVSGGLTSAAAAVTFSAREFRGPGGD